MMTFTIEELRRLEAEATPGPWGMISCSNYHGPYIDGPVGRTICDFYVLKKDNSPKSFDAAQENAALIVAMRNALPELLNALEAARELADWCEFEVGADTGLTPGLETLREYLPPHGGVDVG